MKKRYICSPYRGDIERNTKFAKRAARYIALNGDIPVVPHIYFTEFLNDDIAKEREIGLQLGLELLKCCDELCIAGDRVTEGMKEEIKLAFKLNIPISILCTADINRDYLLP